MVLPSSNAVPGTVDSPVRAAEQIYVESPYHWLHGLKCEFKDETLSIAGQVPSFYLKQLAQIAVQHLDGVKRIRNLIEVSA
jgi:BON domain-containing protein